MAALLLYLIAKIRPPRETRFHHVWGLPLPPVLHQTIEQDSLEKYEEIFVIGDVHGCYDELQLLLQQANVLTDKVLKIFVGDLVNKGPKSPEVLKFVRSLPSTLSVRGNHDEVVLRVYNDTLDPTKEIQKKNEWIKSLSKEDIEYLHALPYTIRLPSLCAIIVHAGLIPGKPIENIHPTDLVSMRNIVLNDYFWEGGVKAKKHGKGFGWAELWPGPEHVYFGHDAKRLLQRHKFATGLDTGCVYGKQLTGTFIKGPREGTFISVKAKQVYETPKG